MTVSRLRQIPGIGVDVIGDAADATPMDGWGPSGDHYLRLVFANEPAERLADLGDRCRRALG
jgi:hypothetical protein